MGTTGKKVRFNGNNWITIPELGTANGIPAGHNGECYISEPTVVVNVPLVATAHRDELLRRDQHGADLLHASSGASTGGTT